MLLSIPAFHQHRRQRREFLLLSVKTKPRHRPSKHENLPAGFESHIFYEINPGFRGLGYAKNALHLLLCEAKRFGLDHVIIVADQKNLASNAVIRSRGAVLVGEGEALGGVVYLKYGVSLK